MSQKRGIVWPLENHDDRLDIFPFDRTHWFYNWSTDKQTDVNVEFVPMIWNAHGIDQFGEKVRSQNTK